MKSEGRSKKFLVTDDDSNKPLRRALFFGVLTALGAAVVGTIIAGIVVGKPGGEVRLWELPPPAHLP